MNNKAIAIPGYPMGEQLYSGSRTQVYRGICESDQKPVILKLLKSDYPTFNELLQFRNQYTIAKNLDLPGVVKHLCLENYRNSYVLVMEDFGGISLKDWTLGGMVGTSPNLPLPIKHFLPIAIQIAQALEQLSAYRVIH